MDFPDGIGKESAPPVVQYVVPLSQKMLESMVCPACRQPLDYSENPESLKCTGCHRVYPVKDGIPIMLIDEATMEK